MNLNQLAIAISKVEGKKVQVNIAQIKEILKITIDLLNDDALMKEVMSKTKPKAPKYKSKIRARRKTKK